MIIDNAPALIPLVYLLTAIIIPITAMKKYGISFYLGMLAATTSFALSIMNLAMVLKNGTIHYHFGGWPPPIGIEYVMDHLSSFVCLVINFIAFIVLLHSKNTVEKELSQKKMPYYAVAMLMLCGFNGIVMTGDFFNLYVFLEISSLSLYGLIAVGERKSPIAAFRYLIMGAVGASFYLLGVGFLYLISGSLNMADLQAILPSIYREPTAIVALAMMVMGIGIKMAVFPLHGWLPDSYTYAPSTTAALVAPTGTKIGAYVMLRILIFSFGIKYITGIVPVATVLAWLSAIGIIYGSIMAIAQKEMKRMLAYSSVAQIGYIGLGIGMANLFGLIGAILHIMNHALMKACLFLVSGNYRFRLHHSNIQKMNHSIRKLMPWTTASFAVAAISMVGIPPTVGFFSKLYLVMGSVQKSNWVFLAVILASSLLNAVYFFRILEKVYMKDPGTPAEEEDRSEETKKKEVGFSMLLPTLILAAAIIIMGIFSAIIVKTVIINALPPGVG